MDLLIAIGKVFIAKREDESVFEVEKLLNDKIVKRQRHYLVRWVGFTKAH